MKFILHKPLVTLRTLIKNIFHLLHSTMTIPFKTQTMLWQVDQPSGKLGGCERHLLMLCIFHDRWQKCSQPITDLY